MRRKPVRMLVRIFTNLSVNGSLTCQKSTVENQHFPTLTIFETCYLMENIDIYELIWKIEIDIEN